jgi:hypothetical protein
MPCVKRKARQSETPTSAGGWAGPSVGPEICSGPVKPIQGDLASDTAPAVEGLARVGGRAGAGTTPVLKVRRVRSKPIAFDLSHVVTPRGDCEADSDRVRRLLASLIAADLVAGGKAVPDGTA